MEVYTYMYVHVVMARIAEGSKVMCYRELLS